jgi:extracellular elastinolytic metalloproteinase
MSREMDRRDPASRPANIVTPAPAEPPPAGLAAPIEGRGLVEAAPPGDYVQRALDFVQQGGGERGLLAATPPEYVADPHPQQTSSGAVAVHLQQEYKGIPVFQAAQTVRFAPDGSLQETVGTDVPVSGAALEGMPQLPVQEAVRQAAEYVAAPDPDAEQATSSFGLPLTPPSVDLTDFVPQVTAAFPEKADRPTVLAAGPFGDEIKAGLVWFPLADGLRLAWDVLLTMPDYAGQYRTLVDATSGEILYCRQLIHSLLAQGNVFRRDGASERQMTPFPRLQTAYNVRPVIPPPDGFPDSWVAADRTEGNCVVAQVGDTGQPLIADTDQHGMPTFNPPDKQGNEQKMLNAFYYNCYIHDYFYLLGFREADGNFQADNFGRGGTPGDPVSARIYNDARWGMVARMITPVDGHSSIMEVGQWPSNGGQPARHAAFDAGIIFHEFSHGVTNRLVGGRVNTHALDEPQSSGMGEGWGDYFACTINGTTVVGAWLTGRAGGIRRNAYDSRFPDRFDQVGTGKYNEAHEIGEIWCATLMEMNRNIGADLAVQLVVDALKLSPANPSFLNMRDAILAALDHRLTAGLSSAADHAAALRGIWQAFAKFGMGPAARSNGATLTGISSDGTLPAGLAVAAPVAPPPPANGTAPDVTSIVTIPTPGRLSRLAVALDLASSPPGPLQVRLVTPAGRTVTLHDGVTAPPGDLLQVYTSADTPALAQLAGEVVQGDWTLHVVDLTDDAPGTLRQWSLEIGLVEAS